MCSLWWGVFNFIWLGALWFKNLWVECTFGGGFPFPFLHLHDARSELWKNDWHQQCPITWAPDVQSRGHLTRDINRSCANFGATLLKF
jgi:hypothetical protein